MLEHDDPGDLTGKRTTGGQPLPPLADTHKARVDALYSWYLELITLDGDQPHTAALKVITAAVPGGQQPLPTAAKIVLTTLGVIALAFLIPAVLWAVGYVIVPLWWWGTSWL